jgi:VIT1/CCC1 family predicted Fe2+/Mn2+ transporter
LPSLVASIVQPAELEAICRRVVELPEPPERARLDNHDWLGGVAVFFWVFLATFPVVVPFIFMEKAGPALRVSNTIAVLMLFLTGYAFGHLISRRPWAIGISMVFLGVILVGITMALGG